MRLRRRLLELVDDAPANVELRALLLDERTRLYGEEGGAIARGDEARVLAVHGAPLSEIVHLAVRDTGEGWSLLCSVPVATVTAPLQNWTWKRAVVLTLAEVADLDTAVTHATEIAPLGDARLDHLGDLGPAIEAARQHRLVMAAWADGKPVSFAYPGLRTESWFDVSVDTLPAYRDRGLARLCAAALIARERRGGRRPVWGAIEDNAPSLRVAAALGFRAVDFIWVATPRAQGGLPVAG